MLYAKSNPVESVKAHTDNLLKEYKNLKNTYGKEIEKCVCMDKERFWQLLYIACEYHDLGKSNTTFQNVIRKVLKIETLKDDIEQNIPHNYLSPAFIPSKDANLSKEERRLLIQTIAFHHERKDEPIKELIKKIIDEDLNLKLIEINEEMNLHIEKLDKKFTKELEQRIKENEEIYKDYILMKGLLHRIDHAASAHQEIEDNTKKGVGLVTKAYIEEKFKSGIRPAQEFSYINRDKNVLLVASTGIGKTESALLWIDDDKGFFTLPLRVSINALFTRVKDEINYEFTGLIHSTSMDYLDEQGYENSSEIYEQSKLLSKKLSFSTIDQIFKFPFKYKGYEKIYSTLAYSKVVIDEIQAYSPQITAVILKGLEMIDKIGGKFMVMTATLPRIYKDYLNEKDIKLEEAQYLSPMKRHKISVINEEINESIENIVKRAENNKVIVIVNTVKKAMEMYREISNRIDNCYLLHSMFIQRDRAEYEKDIKNFADNKDKNGEQLEEKNTGVWITTQIVEASLDVDFDYLFTEMPTLDSLFQRLGRCYRKREFDRDEPNVYIYIKNPSGKKYIYDEDILNKSIEMIKNHSGRILEEKDKVSMVDALYSKESLIGTKFYEDFINALKFLDNMLDYDLTGSEAQKVLRDIDSVRAIPKEIFDDNYKLFEAYEEAEGEVKFKILRDINKLTVNIPMYKCRGKVAAHEYIKNLFILDTKYSKEEGVLLEEAADNIF